MVTLIVLQDNRGANSSLTGDLFLGYVRKLGTGWEISHDREKWFPCKVTKQVKPTRGFTLTQKNGKAKGKRFFFYMANSRGDWMYTRKSEEVPNYLVSHGQSVLDEIFTQL